MKPLIFYSQNREDLILYAFFADKKDGFYVDVGAHHPTRDSVTKFFYEKGWHGINIEPQKRQFNLLARSRKRDINLNIGVSNKPGKLILRSYSSDGLSTFSSGIKKEYEQKMSDETSKFRDITIQVDTLSNIFDSNNVSMIQFLKVDVEGLEYEVLEGNDWKKYRPEVICIESNHIVKDWHNLLKVNNYVYAFFDGLNEYFVAEESRHRIELFKKSFPETLVSAPILSNDWNAQIKKLVATVRRLQRALDNQVKITHELDQMNQNKEKLLSNKKLLTKSWLKRATSRKKS